MPSAHSQTFGQPFWPTHCATGSPELTYPPLDHDLKCDVAIVGAGITGALIAYELSQIGAKVIVLDAGTVGHASTSASTSLILSELDTPLVELAEFMGYERASLVYRMCVEAIDRLARTVEEIGGNCDFRRRQSLYVASKSGDERLLEQEFEARRRCGIELEYLGSNAIARRYPFRRQAALLSPSAAEADPLKLTRELLRAAAARGVSVHELTNVARWDRERSGHISIDLDKGAKVRPDHVVLATGYAAESHLRKKLANVQTTYAIVSEPMPDLRDNWPDQCLIWETGHPYAYLRSTLDGRALIGGGDDDHLGPAAAAQLPGKQKMLEEKFATFFPDMKFKICSAWASAFVTTPDGLPYIGGYSELPNVHFALCYGGNGMTFGVIASQLIRDRILGHPDGACELFDLDRIIQDRSSG